MSSRESDEALDAKLRYSPKLPRQVLSFVAVNGPLALLGLAIFAAINHFFRNENIHHVALLVSFAITAPLSFIVFRLLVFAGPRKSGWEVLQFFGLAVLFLALNQVGLWLLVDKFQLPAIQSQVAWVLFFSALRFSILRTSIFRESRDQ